MPGGSLQAPHMQGRKEGHPALQGTAEHLGTGHCQDVHMRAGTPTPRTGVHTFQVAPAQHSIRHTKCGCGAHTVPTCQ